MSAPADQSLASTVLLHYVLEPAVRSLGLAGAVWLLLKAFRVRDVSFRLAAWTAVLYAALAMPFLGHLLPQLPLPIPIEQAALPSGTRTAAAGALAAVSVHRPAGALVAASATGAATAANASRPAASIPWPALALGLYGVLCGIFLTRLALGIVLSRRLRRSSRPINDGRLAVLLAREARKVGLAKAPPVAESPALSIPATLGIRQPVVLFPPGWRNWNQTQVSAVLAHEFSHIARHDALTQALSHVHRAFFWFSPLSWLLDRALVDLAEQASDDAALLAGADRTRYAEVLLHFLRRLQATRGRVRWQAVSMAQGASSARRLERILSGSKLSRRLGQTALAAVVLSAVPLICLAASLQPSLSAEAPVPPPALSAMPRPPAIASLPAVTAGRKQSSRSVATRAERQPARIFGRRPESAAVRTDVRTEEMEDWYSNSKGRGYMAFAVVSSHSVHTSSGSFTEVMQVREWQGRVRGNSVPLRLSEVPYGVGRPSVLAPAVTAFARLNLPERKRELRREQFELIRELAALEWWQSRARFPSPIVSAAMRQMEAVIRQIGALRTQGRLQPAEGKIEAALEAMASATTWEQLAQAQQQLSTALGALNPSAT